MAIDLENGRRTRGELEQDIKRVTDAFVTGELELGDGEALTPYRIAKAIQKTQELDAMPSPGAVTATLKRWKDLGFAVVNEGPVAFEDYTQEGRDLGLTEMKARASAARKGASSPAPGDSSERTEEQDGPVVPVADSEAEAEAEVEAEEEAIVEALGGGDEPVGSGEYPLP